MRHTSQPSFAPGAILHLPHPSRTAAPAAHAECVVVLDVLEGGELLTIELVPAPADAAGEPPDLPADTLLLQHDECLLEDACDDQPVLSGGFLVRTQRVRLLDAGASASAVALGALRPDALARVL